MQQPSSSLSPGGSSSVLTMESLDSLEGFELTESGYVGNRPTMAEILAPGNTAGNNNSNNPNSTPAMGITPVHVQYTPHMSPAGAVVASGNTPPQQQYCSMANSGGIANSNNGAANGGANNGNMGPTGSTGGTGNSKSKNNQAY